MLPLFFGLSTLLNLQLLLNVPNLFPELLSYFFIFFVSTILSFFLCSTFLFIRAIFQASFSLFLSFLQLTVKMLIMNFLRMTGFEPRTSGIRSDHHSACQLSHNHFHFVLIIFFLSLFISFPRMSWAVKKKHFVLRTKKESKPELLKARMVRRKRLAIDRSVAGKNRTKWHHKRCPKSNLKWLDRQERVSYARTYQRPFKHCAKTWRQTDLRENNTKEKRKQRRDKQTKSFDGGRPPIKWSNKFFAPAKCDQI